MLALRTPLKLSISKTTGSSGQRPTLRISDGRTPRIPISQAPQPSSNTVISSLQWTTHEPSTRQYIEASLSVDSSAHSPSSHPKLSNAITVNNSTTILRRALIATIHLKSAVRGALSLMLRRTANAPALIPHALIYAPVAIYKRSALIIKDRTNLLTTAAR